MKKIVIILIVLMALSTACNRGKTSKKDEVIAKKYCIVNLGVYKTKMQKKAIKWMTRGESLSLLGTEMVTPVNKKAYEVSKVQISSGEIGYATSKYLGEKPAVFIKDTRTFSSNNKTSRILGKIPRGSLGFIMEEKAGWAKVYAVFYEKGKKKTVWMQWIQDGYSSDEDLMVDARIYESIQKMMAAAPGKITDKDISKIEKDIDDLAGKTNIFAELATASKEELTKLKEKIAELKQKKEETTTTENKDAPVGK